MNIRLCTPESLRILMSEVSNYKLQFNLYFILTANNCDLSSNIFYKSSLLIDIKI